MRPRKITKLDLPALLPDGAVVFVQGCSGASDLLAEWVAETCAALGAMTFTGIQIPGINRRSWLPNEASRFVTFFMTPELKRAGTAVTFLPFNYADIWSYLGSLRIDAALFSVSPPDGAGNCSFGPTVDFLAEMWRSIPIRIAHINPALPRTSGSTSIPFDELQAIVEHDQQLPETIEVPADPTTDAIARTVASFVDDGATIQTGLGKIPGSVLRSLDDRRNLRIHSGLVGDGVLDLLEAGAIKSGSDVVAGVAIGSKRFYDALPNSGIQFHPVPVTHGLKVLAKLPSFVTLNSAMELDLFGQGFAEAGPDGWMSGPGGATDFARGARAAGGLRIVALPASAKSASRIVEPWAARGPVSLARNDIDIVVTEYGAADLRMKSHDERAAALIDIAEPEHRERLARSWRQRADRY